MNGRYIFLMVLTFLMGCSKPNDEATAEGLIAQVEPNSANEAAPANKFGFAEAVQGPDLFGSKAPIAQRVTTVDIREEPAPGGSEPRIQSNRPATQTRIAYSYGFGFRIGREKIAKLQEAHSAMCEAMGSKCRILRMSQANSDFDGYGEIKLQIVATEFGAFETALAEPAKKLGGELVSSVRDGEDLSEDIVDNEAKLRSRLVLRGKLTEILRNNKGSVDELIKAEKAVADVNEEIDATRTKLEGYRTRIQFSDVRIEYQPGFGETQLGFARPVMTAARSIGTTLGTTIAVLIYMITALLPITLLILALRWVLHRFGLRIRFWRKNSQVVEPVS